MKKGLLEIFYRDTNRRYISMPFNNLLHEGKDLVVKSMNGLYKMGEFTIHASDIVKVDTSKRKENKLIFLTDRYYMIMSVL